MLGLVELLCTTGASYDGTAGAPAGSFAVRTEIPLNLISLFKAEVTAESPTFTAAGTGPGVLSLARSFTPGGLLTLTPQFTYTAYLVDKTANTRQAAITETLEGEVPFAGKAGVVSLTAGDTYVVQIETTDAASVASVGLFGGETIGRFDNVVVSGQDAAETPTNGKDGADGSEGPAGANGREGGAGRDGNEGRAGATGKEGRAGADGKDGSSADNGSTATTAINSAELKSLAASAVSGEATMTGNRVSVRGACPAKVGATCTISLQGMLNRHKPATAGRRAKIKVGKSKNFALSVKPAVRTTVKAKSTLLFKVTIKAGTASATAYKTLKLIHR